MQALSTKHTSSYAVAKEKLNDVKNRFENIFPCKCKAMLLNIVKHSSSRNATQMTSLGSP